VTTSTKPEVHT